MKFSNVFSGSSKKTNGFDLNNKAPHTDAPQQISSFRRYLPQIIASSVKNLLIVDFGLTIAYSTILIPALTGRNTAHNPNETLSITPDQATWLASITLICQPIGGVASGFITEPFGRKIALILVNIPYFVAWIMLYYASSLTMIYTSFVLLGLGLGLMEAPIFTYIGEICEPSIRGILTATGSVSATFGTGLVYFLGSQTSWRNAALICAIIPLLAIVLISFMPETPLWLLLRNRESDALKSLQWLRGWVDSSAVQTEFNELQRSRNNAQICYTCEKQNETCSHPPPTIRDKIRDLFRKRTLRPFILIGCLFFLSAFCTISSYRPYMVQVFNYYQTPIDANQTIVWMGYFGFLSKVLLVFTVRPFGKRPAFLWSMGIVVLTLFALGIYGFLWLPLDTTSFDIHTNTADSQSNASPKQYIPIVAFYILEFSGNYGVVAIPNLMMCEVFPVKSKSFATGLVAVIYYLSLFVASKSFYALEVLLTLPGIGILYGLVGLVGFIGTYLTLPETEGRSLEDIESYFANRKRKFNDIQIPYKEETTHC